MDTSFPILLGVLSSLVAAAIIAVLTYVTKNIVLPWYSDLIYRGVRLDGEWMVTAIDGHANPQGYFMRLILTQKGDRIVGTEIHTFDSHGAIVVENNSVWVESLTHTSR